MQFVVWVNVMQTLYKNIHGERHTDMTNASI